MLLVAVVVEVAETNICQCRTSNFQPTNIGCVYSYCSTMQTNHRSASANVVGGGSGGNEYSAEVEQEANQANIGCVFSSTKHCISRPSSANAQLASSGGKWRRRIFLPV